MQKLLVGCLIVVVLCAIGLGIAGYLGYRAAQPALQQAREYVSSLGKLGELDELDAQIANSGTFEPPADSALTAGQVDDFVRVQQHMREALGSRMTEIETKYKGLQGEEGRQPTPTEVFSGLSDIAGLFVDARRSQVEALNAEGLSQSEYDWIRRSVYAAAGIEMASTFNLRRLQEMAKDGARQVGLDPDEMPSPDVPPQNRELVKPHLEEMQAWLPLAFFGF